MGRRKMVELVANTIDFLVSLGKTTKNKTKIKRNFKGRLLFDSLAVSDTKYRLPERVTPELFSDPDRRGVNPWNGLEP